MHVAARTTGAPLAKSYFYSAAYASWQINGSGELLDDPADDAILWNLAKTGSSGAVNKKIVTGGQFQDGGDIKIVTGDNGTGGTLWEFD